MNREKLESCIKEIIKIQKDEIKFDVSYNGFSANLKAEGALNCSKIKNIFKKENYYIKDLNLNVYISLSP